jgi:hypothetical protein
VESSIPSEHATSDIFTNLFELSQTRVYSNRLRKIFSSTEGISKKLGKMSIPEI